MISVRFQGKPFNITVIQVFTPTSNAEEAEVEWFCDDLQDLLELTPKKDIFFNTEGRSRQGFGGYPVYFPPNAAFPSLGWGGALSPPPLSVGSQRVRHD